MQALTQTAGWRHEVTAPADVPRYKFEELVRRFSTSTPHSYATQNALSPSSLSTKCSNLASSRLRPPASPPDRGYPRHAPTRSGRARPFVLHTSGVMGELSNRGFEDSLTSSFTSGR